MKTTDYGRTFTPPVLVTAANADGAYTWQGNLAVGNGGKDLYVVHSRRALPLHLPGPLTIAVAASHDGGATWTSHDIATLPGDTASLYPSIAVDAGGRLHVVWSAARAAGDSPVFYTASHDRGTTWSPPRALNPGGGARGAWVAGGAKGQARIAWLGTPVDTRGSWDLYFYAAKVDNGRTVALGRTTTRPVRVGDVPGPEFEMVRLDRRGRMHVAMTVPHGPGGWAFYYQRESAR